MKTLIIQLAKSAREYHQEGAYDFLVALSNAVAEAQVRHDTSEQDATTLGAMLESLNELLAPADREKTRDAEATAVHAHLDYLLN